MSANALWDSGSTLSLITTKLARSLHLKGEKIFLSIDTVSGQRSFESKQHTIRLRDASGIELDIVVVEIEKISSQVSKSNIALVKEMFPKYSAKIHQPLEGEVDLLIGMQYAAFQPVSIDSREHLLLMKNRFGILIAGTHRDCNEKTVIDQSVFNFRHGIALHITESIEKTFFEIEGLGVTCNPRCGSCKCGKCHLGGKNISLLEEKEYDAMETRIKFNVATGRYIAEYPWNRNPEILENNK